MSSEEGQATLKPKKGQTNQEPEELKSSQPHTAKQQPKVEAEEDEEEVTVRKKPKNKMTTKNQEEKKTQEKKAEEDDEEEEGVTVKKSKRKQKQKVVQDDNDDEDGATVKKKSKGKKQNMEEFKKDKEEEEVVATLSNIQAKAKESDFEILHGSRILVKEIREEFSNFPKEKLESLATMNQVLHFVDVGTEINYDNNKSIAQFMADRGYNYKEIDSLDFLAKGGQSYVLRAELKQPIEVVAKMVLPKAAGAEAMVEILNEGHFIKLLDDKSLVVNILEEIIEFNQAKNQIENFIVLVEQARYDLNNIVSFWLNSDKQIENTEYFTNEKLFYFLLRACQAVAYCHSQQVYYGDMKEANILVFRDYTVKLGDFGIAIKFDNTQDPNEKIYEMKGATPGYSQPFIQEALAQGSGDMYSINDLLKNDYYCLAVTFKKVMNKVRQAISRSILPNTLGKDYEDVYVLEFIPQSYFVQMLSELENLDPVQGSLQQLVDKYSQIAGSDRIFLNSLCDSIIDDEKFQALPNVLQFWKHASIPRLISKYFTQLQNQEFPFLVPDQKCRIPSDDIYLKKQQILARDEVIQELKGYIKTAGNFWKEFKLVLPTLVSYRLALSPHDYYIFYRDLFAEFYQLEAFGQTHSLIKLIQDDKETFLKILKSSPEARKFCIQFGKFYAALISNQENMKYEDIAFIVDNLEDGSQDSCNNYMIILSNAIQGEYNQSKASLIKKYFKQISSYYPNLPFARVTYRQLKNLYFHVYAQMLLETNYNSKDKQKYILNLWNKSLLSKKVLRMGVSSLMHESNYKEQGKTFIEEELNSVRLSRSVLQKSWGELGNQLSQNAYRLYQQLKMKYEMDKKEETYEEALKFIRKAYNYSLKSEKGIYT